MAMIYTHTDRHTYRQSFSLSKLALRVSLHLRVGCFALTFGSLGSCAFCALGFQNFYQNHLWRGSGVTFSAKQSANGKAWVAKCKQQSPIAKVLVAKRNFIYIFCHSQGPKECLGVFQAKWSKSLGAMGHYTHTRTHTQSFFYCRDLKAMDYTNPWKGYCICSKQICYIQPKFFYTIRWTSDRPVSFDLLIPKTMSCESTQSP